jgi:hypothetical protein
MPIRLERDVPRVVSLVEARSTSNHAPVNASSSVSATPRRVFALTVLRRVLAPVILVASAASPASDAPRADFIEPDYWKRPIPAQGPLPSTEPLSGQVLPDLSAETCALCHPLQYAAWSESFHARAVSPGLLGQLAALDGATQDSCLACHAPREESLDAWHAGTLEEARAIAAVDCAACHVREHVRHGPRQLEVTPHGPVPETPLFRRAEFCAPCHQFDETGLSVNGKPLENTYVEWRASRYAEEGITCQDCHMPDRVHAFKGIHDPETTRRGLAVEAVRHDRGIRVRAGNVGAGHALPTYVTPRILIEITADTGAPTLLYVIARQMRWSLDAGWEELADTRLSPDQWVTLDLPLPPGAGGRVRVRVEPDYDYSDRVYPTLLSMLGETLSQPERDMLMEARTLGGQTPYDLYRFTCAPWSGHREACFDETP